MKKYFSIILFLIAICSIGPMTHAATVATLAIEPKYLEVNSFSDGLAFVNDKNYDWGVIDVNGNEIAKPLYDMVGSFSEGLAPVLRGGGWGYIDKTGKEVIKPQYSYADNFQGGMAAVRKDNMWGAIDKTGKVVIKFKYDGVDISEGVAVVFNYPPKGSNNQVDRVLDKTGKEIFKYARIGPFSEGLASFTNNHNTYGYIDKKGKIVIKPKYHSLRMFTEGLAAVNKNEKWGFIDKTGKEMSKFQYDDFYPFNQGLAAVSKGNK
jgi:hypothetical protein